VLEHKLVIGVDEAGYGPSMGPLTICATAWRVPMSFDADQMTHGLKPEFLTKPLQLDSIHIPIGDSKKIHQGKLAAEGLLLGSRFIAYLIDGKIEDDWDHRIKCFAREDWKRLSKIPWYGKVQSKHSRSLNEAIADQPCYFEAAATKLKSSSIELVGVQSRVIDEIEFNRHIDLTGNKSILLSESTLTLVKDVIMAISTKSELIEVYCDKHGGRNRYQSILTHIFDQEWFSIEIESQGCSRYTANWNGHLIQIQFKVEGDSIFPSAAASIIAKWTREDLMERLNAFWQENILDGVKPTAGYYVDAMRFAEQIQASARRLRLDRDSWWRKK